MRQEKERDESSKVEDELDSVTESALPDLSISEIDFDEAFAEYRTILDRFDVRVQVCPTGYHHFDVYGGWG